MSQNPDDMEREIEEHKRRLWVLFWFAIIQAVAICFLGVLSDVRNRHTTERIRAIEQRAGGTKP